MSYILDALKKAESDRRLGSVPDIHTHEIAAAESDGGAPLWAKPWVWAVFALLVLSLIAAAWRQPWHTTPVAIPSTALQVQAAPTTTPTAVPPPAAVVTAAVAPPAAGAVEPVARPAVIEKPAVSKPRQSAPPVVARPDKAMAQERKPAPETPAPAEPRVANLRELPQNIQAEIPPLVVTGYIYSKNQADRSVLINNKLLREGEQVAPGLVLEKMTQKEAVLNYKGYRYRLSY